MMIISIFLFTLSLSGILLIFLFDPILVCIGYLTKRKKVITYPPIRPSVSLLIVVRNAENLIVDKIKNSLSIHYPSDDYEIVIFSDGSTDGTEDKIKFFPDKRIRFLSSPVHEGKNSGINKAIPYCTGEIIVFSDVDAIIDKDAIIHLTKYFSDPEVGGVCGNIHEKAKDVQSNYVTVKSVIKRLENQIVSTTSNKGKLYAVRKSLFPVIPLQAIDDLYVCLSVVHQKYKFLFAPEANAFSKTFPKNSIHEIKRRRRTIIGSLCAVSMVEELLNPFKFGIFSIRLILNKIMKRLLAAFLLFLFFSSLYLSPFCYAAKILMIAQTSFYMLALSYRIVFQYTPGSNVIKEVTSVVYYFCIGTYGNLIGVLDFIMGKQIVKWEPLNTDVSSMK
ncbi:MAG: glycosyltransferase [wastewater metagenome]|nr:glycosyltransferase [Candidatus Loosdrechtia aerotolerans]